MRRRHRAIGGAAGALAAAVLFIPAILYLAYLTRKTP